MIICALIYTLVAAIMVGIGVWNLKSKTPVTFYSGEKPMDPRELTDVEGWNRDHGRMWLTYGCLIALSAVIGFLLGDSLWCLIPYMGGVVVPLPLRVLYHHRLLKRYHA